MFADVTEAKAVGDHLLSLRFADGRAGTIDLAEVVPFRGVLAPLADPAFFALVRVDPEAGTVAWPNGVDLDPDVLYSQITGTPLPGYASTIGSGREK